MPSDVVIVRKRVIEDFFRRTWHRGKLNRLIIISPWLSAFRLSTSHGLIDIDALMRRISNEGTYLSIVTRYPKESWHKEAIDKLRNTKVDRKSRVQIKFNDNLHAKIYVLKANGFEACLVGSPNLTSKSLENAEVGIYIRHTPDTRKLFQELLNVSRDLINQK